MNFSSQRRFFQLEKNSSEQIFHWINLWVVLGGGHNMVKLVACVKWNRRQRLHSESEQIYRQRHCEGGWSQTTTVGGREKEKPAPWILRYACTLSSFALCFSWPLQWIFNGLYSPLCILCSFYCAHLYVLLWFKAEQSYVYHEQLLLLSRHSFHPRFLSPFLSCPSFREFRVLYIFLASPKSCEIA